MMLPISDVAARLGLTPDLLEPYGHAIAKIKLEALERFPARRGKLILVTAITPTTSGEGKTVNTIGLTQGLVKLGHNAVAALREPSLGPVFGMKGGATGGGKASLSPIDRINLHFTGDFHAITSAHNLLAALIDTHLHFGNDLRLDAKEILWPRCMDMNDRALRRIATGLGGRESGPARETGFVITAASEIMAILALADGRADLRQRLGRIVVGFNYDGKPVTAADLKAVGPMMLLLNDALMPNLVQTTEGAPAIVHCGPFANIAHGTSSVLAQRIGLHLADFVVNETGFAADLGAEKFFDLVMPMCGHVPAAAAVIVTLKALRTQGGSPDGPVDLGFPNLARHFDNLKRWGVQPVIALNRFPGDKDDDLDQVLKYCRTLGADAAICEGYTKGGEGMQDLAAKIVAVASTADPSKVKPIYAREQSLTEKIAAVATQVYGAERVSFKPAAKSRLEKFEQLGYGKLPVCIAKTQYSFTDDPKQAGAPIGWPLTISDVTLSAGAGFVVAIAGAMMLMPGLGKVPQAQKLDVDDQGRAIGMEY
ncbi:MAG TPA: formate--tetrahydrofolate ligase [Vicinamibacterales bacterium]|nr:formate--tetrahydrofolate ligase [Vicinamibacterales bacterium]